MAGMVVINPYVQTKSVLGVMSVFRLDRGGLALHDERDSMLARCTSVANN